ncbi:MAG TPA: triose-phosphate isomerase [Clostridia bacterium]|nr:triose-phosphate isomerase [Clostridia bacterium]
MRKEILAGNWKMNHGPKEALAFLKDFFVKPGENQRVILCPPYISLESMKRELPEKIELAAQNIHEEDKGAFTGEVSAPMIKELGVGITLLGHSERRNYYKESDELVRQKLKKALEHNLEVILCVGEQLEHRESGRAEQVVKKQVLSALKGLKKEDMESVHIAYEPVWAIGTGKTASSQDAQEMNAYIRSLIVELFNDKIAQETSILYGGSVKPENIKELMAMEDIDGALVGGASLDPISFAKLLDY